LGKAEAHGDFEWETISADSKRLNSALDQGDRILQKLGVTARVNVMLDPMGYF
jgi:hypothetical protein